LADDVFFFVGIGGLLFTRLAVVIAVSLTVSVFAATA
jgi:hypothetical protein